jgi:hypothetical protein
LILETMFWNGVLWQSTWWGRHNTSGLCSQMPVSIPRLIRDAGWNGNCGEDEYKRCLGDCGSSFVECQIHCPAGYDTDSGSCTAITYECN